MNQPESRNLPIADADTTVHHRPRRQRSGAGPPRMALNLTAMIDVTFLLVIYFVVTASFSPGEGILTAKLPQGTGTAALAKLPPQPLAIVVRDAGPTGCRLSIEDFATANPPRDFRELHELLVRLQYDKARGRTSGMHKPDDPVIIKPSGQVRWQHVVNAFNAAVRAGYENIAFAQAP